MLAKHTLNAGLGQFVNQILPWVFWKRDVYYAKEGATSTLQECLDCGAEVRKALSTWTHHCHNCGSIKPRDVAAAQVISTRGQWEIENACGVDVAGAEVTQSSGRAVKQEIFGVTQGITTQIKDEAW